jgi:hypothetical protein
VQVKVVAPVWGIEYIENFIKLSLASQLSKNNLPLISQKYKVEYVIYTQKSDKQYLENSEIIKILKNFVTIRFETINKFKMKNTYRLYGQIHHRELKKSSKKNEGVFLINADFIFSDGFFDQTLNEIKNGKRVVNIACPRANLESVQRILLSKFSKSKNIIEINSKKLSSVYLRNTHKMMKYHLFPKSKDDDFLPSTMMWRANNDSLYLRNFHFHPILIYPNLIKIKKIKMTIDDGYIYRIFDREDVYFQKNTSNYFAFELSKESLFYRPIGKYKDYIATLYYFIGQDKTNFINYCEEVTIGKVSKKEMATMKLQSEIEINRLMGYLLYETSKYKSAIRFYNVFLRYRLFSIYVVKNTAYVPDFIYLLLKKMHRLIIREVFKIKNYF